MEAADSRPIVKEGGSLVLQDSVFKGNIAKQKGGAIYSQGSTFSIVAIPVVGYKNTIFEDNRADNGGAIATYRI